MNEDSECAASRLRSSALSPQTQYNIDDDLFQAAWLSCTTVALFHTGWQLSSSELHLQRIFDFLSFYFLKDQIIKHMILSLQASYTMSQHDSCYNPKNCVCVLMCVYDGLWSVYDHRMYHFLPSFMEHSVHAAVTFALPALFVKPHVSWSRPWRVCVHLNEMMCG